MKVRPIVNNFLKNNTGTMHKALQSALGACIESALNQNALTVTSIGRGIASDAYEKHSIKRCDRLCSNGICITQWTIYTAVSASNGFQIQVALLSSWIGLTWMTVAMPF